MLSTNLLDSSHEVGRDRGKAFRPDALMKVPNVVCEKLESQAG